MIIKRITKKQNEILKEFEKVHHNRYARIIEFKREDDIKIAEELVAMQYLIRMSDYAYIRNPYTPEKTDKERFVNYFHRYFFDGFPNMLAEVGDPIRYDIYHADKEDTLNTIVILLSVLSDIYREIWGYTDSYYSLEDTTRLVSKTKQ